MSENPTEREPRLDLVAHIREQIESGQYVTDGKLKAVARTIVGSRTRRRDKKRKQARKRKRQEANRPARQQRGYMAFDPVSRDEWRVTLDAPPTDDPLTQLLQILPAMRGLMCQRLSRDSCISSSKILANLARAMGLDAVVQSVRVDVFNPVLAAYLDARDWTLPDDPLEAGRVQAAGGHVLVAGADDLTLEEADEDDGVGWNGHLVVVVGGDLLLDLTFDQFDRPHKGIPIDTNEPFVGPWSEDGGGGYRSDGVVVRYRPRDNQDYTTATDWTRRYVITVNGVEHHA
jgi:hypothetical protein